MGLADPLCRPLFCPAGPRRTGSVAQCDGFIRQARQLLSAAARRSSLQPLLKRAPHVRPDSLLTTFAPRSERDCIAVAFFSA
jgi:hypothetical protein